jgi:hypothetical protein
MTIVILNPATIQSELQGLHWIARMRPTPIIRGDSTLRNLDLLRAAGVIVADRHHFTGLRVRRNLLSVEIHDDGTVIRHETSRSGTRTVTYRRDRALGG